MRIVLLDSKATDEIIPVSFEFSKLIKSIDSVVITVSVRKGADANPTDLLLSSAVINSTTVQQLIKNGVEGVIYKIKANITSGDVKYSLSAYLAVREPV